MSKLDDLLNISYERGKAEVAPDAPYIVYADGSVKYPTLKDAYKALMLDLISGCTYTFHPGGDNDDDDFATIRVAELRQKVEEL